MEVKLEEQTTQGSDKIQNTNHYEFVYEQTGNFYHSKNRFFQKLFLETVLNFMMICDNHRNHHISEYRLHAGIFLKLQILKVMSAWTPEMAKKGCKLGTYQLVTSEQHPTESPAAVKSFIVLFRSFFGIGASCETSTSRNWAHIPKCLSDMCPNRWKW